MRNLILDQSQLIRVLKNIMIPTRLTYWLIHPVWLFYLLAAIAVAVFLAGVYFHIAVWRKMAAGRPIRFSWPRLGAALTDSVTGRRIFRGNAAAGLMHLLILWGFLLLFVGTVLVAVDHWFVVFLRGNLYRWVETTLDVSGLMLLTGLLWALGRRYLQRVLRLERGWAAAGIPGALILVAFSGYLAEGCRLAAQNPAWGEFSFAGWRLISLWPDEQTAHMLYPVFWWLHALISLSFIAYLPYSRLFHILAAPMSTYLKDEPPPVIPTEDRENQEAIYDLRQAVFIDACTRCGRCVAVCPSTSAGEPFSPRDYILWARENLKTTYHPLSKNSTPGPDAPAPGTGFTEGRIWHCTTCRACLEVCPVYVATPEALRQTRSKVVEAGSEVPDALSQTLKKVYKYNNPWEATKTKRTKWSEGLEIPDLTKGAEDIEFCYFVGCTTAMETRAQSIARSFTAILNHAGVAFGTLGRKEPCCGDIARRAGEDGLFEINREDCTALFEGHGISQVVTSSPHCFHTFKNTYAHYAVLEDDASKIRFTARHYTEVLADLVTEGRLQFKQELPLTVTFHDPCYLGRYNRIFDVPRRVIQAIPGIRFKEMAHHGPDSLCCGGGGDRMWQEELDADPKMSVIRIREAEAAGVDLVITACPLCLIMLEDARKGADLEDKLQVMDLNELVVKAVGG